MKDLSDKYTVTTSTIKNGEGVWDSMIVNINCYHTIIGTYTRNYPTFYNTFLPFEKNGKEYALYSKDYYTLSLMSLPDCEHIIDDEKDDGAEGFAIVDIMIPDITILEKEIKEIENLIIKYEKSGDEDNCLEIAKYDLNRLKKYLEFDGTRALVSGCVWGDDMGGFQLKMVDISQIENGRLKYLEDELGYVQLPDIPQRIKDIIVWTNPTQIDIPIAMSYKIDNESSGFIDVDNICEYLKKL